MATLPFMGPIKRPRQPLTGSRLIIVASAIGFALFLLWAMLAQVDEVTSGQGKVIPSSKAQLIQAALPTSARTSSRSGPADASPRARVPVVLVMRVAPRAVLARFRPPVGRASW